MTKEKIIQIVYNNNEPNPTCLTSHGRIIEVCPTGEHYTDKDGDTIPLTKWKDITPDLSKIK